MLSLRRIICISIRQINTFAQKTPQPLRSKKQKSVKNSTQYFIDLRKVRALGGRGGDGCISFLHLWANENAGPDGGDGGNGGHIIFQATTDIKDLKYISSILKAEDGEKGHNKDCNGKNASHTIVPVPLGTIIRNNKDVVVGDLSSNGAMFIAARGGSGGKGNHFFISDTEQTPEICEYGAQGEDIDYTLEIRSMAHVGLLGFPNAGKSTLLSAISRAKPKIAPYPFTTLKPHLGMIQYDDYEQIAVADLPGLIPDSHKNKGLGIQFLKHVERCNTLIYVIDISAPEPWKQLESLRYELSQFNKDLSNRSEFVVANKIDIAGCENNLNSLKECIDLPVVAVSAKYGTNLLELLQKIREVYDEAQICTESQENKDL